MIMSKGFVLPLIVLLCIVSIPFVKADWAMYQADPSHNGEGTGSPVFTSNVLWKIMGPSFENGTSSWSAPTIVDGIVYVGSGFSANPSGYHLTSWGDVYAFKASNGGLVWDYRDNSSNGIGTPAVVNEVVYFSSNTYVGALKASNGASLWNNTANGGTSPVVINGVFYDNNGHIMYALNATDGNQLWASDVPGLTPPAVANGIVYTGSLDHNLYALDATNGDKLWNYTTGSFVESSPAIASGVVYVGSDDGNVYALNASTGNKIWSYPTKDFVTSSPAVANGIVYVGSQNDNVYALNATTGIVIWGYPTSYPVSSSPAVNGGVVYIGSNDLNVYALNASTGTKIWSYPTAEFVNAFAVAGGSVCVSTGDGSLYAFGSSPTSLFSTLFIEVGVTAVIVIVAAVVVLMFKKRLKNQTKNPQTTSQNSMSISLFKFIRRNED